MSARKKIGHFFLDVLVLACMFFFSFFLHSQVCKFETQITYKHITKEI
jgi:hypothetical protein